MKNKLLLIACIVMLAGGIIGWTLTPDPAQAGKIIFKRNVVFRAFYSLTLNGSMATSSNAYPQSLGGVEDYNNNQTMPADSYRAAWTACSAGNNYCGTGTSTADAKDNSTGLIWSKWLEGGTAKNWFWANNCAYPNGLSSDGTCNTHGEEACRCVKLTSNKTGCEALGGGWRLPHQKELLQAYIDGSWGNLSSADGYYWSATTRSSYTHYAWYTHLTYGLTSDGLSKTSTRRVRCVR